MVVDEDDEEQEMDTLKDQESPKFDSLPSYFSEKSRSWEEPTPSISSNSPYQFSTQPDTQEQVLKLKYFFVCINLNEIHYNK